MSELKLMTYNCRGLGGQEKRRDVVNYIKKLDFDINLLQDTHLIPRTIPFFNTLWRGKCYHSCGTVNSRGASILFKPTVQHSIIHEEYCSEGNFIILVCNIFSNTYTIVNIYGPNDDRPTFFEQLYKRLEELPCDNIILGGDFNFVINYLLDSNYCQQNNPRARNAFVMIAEQLNLVDVWKEKNPDIDGFTWGKQNPLKYGRLDRLYVQEHLINHVTTARMHAGYRSDHNIVSLNIKEPQKTRGPGLWKFNESLLDDEAYIVLVRQVIIDVVKQYAIPVYSDEFSSNPNNFEAIQFTIKIGLLYETLLMMIRGETVRYSKQKTRRCRMQESEIMSEISQLTDSFNMNKTHEDFSRLEEAQRKLEDIRKPKIQGLITRSRVKWHEEGEKCSKYFLTLEKRNGTRNSIQCLKVNECIITEKKTILKYFSENLQAKYCQQMCTINPVAYLNNNIKRKLSVQQKDALDAPLSLRELHAALTAMKKGRSPGSNGFTADFFKRFWDFLGGLLFRAVTEELEIHSSLASHRESIVTLIPKQGKPRDSMKGWRPISLLNVDFKIVSAAIANRLKTVIEDLISPSQTAYIPGRFIGENSRLIYDVIEHTNATSSSGIIAAVDFEAAFDTVSWNFLEAALDCYNFGPFYKKMIKTFYLNSSNFSRILLDGYLGTKIHMERGIRQGDPVSGYLFNLVMEPLTNQILQSENVHGITVTPEVEVRISQYADDLIVFSQAEFMSIKGVLNEVEIFSQYSGLRINVEKTKCLRIGQYVDISFLEDLGVQTVCELKVLGVIYNSSNQGIVSRNINEIVPKISQEIAQWKRRKLTLVGKVTVVKALLISKLVHIFSALPNPSKDNITHINNLLYKFIWSDGPDKIKRQRLVQSYEEGGLKMFELVSFIKSLKISWLKRLYWANPNLIWAKLVKAKIPQVNELACFGTAKLHHVAKNNLSNRFWSDVVNAWADLLAGFSPDTSQLLTEKLWFSDYTKFKKSIVKKWDEKGLRFIADLCNHETGRLLDRTSLCELFNIKMTYLCHLSLIRSLPAQVRASYSVHKTPHPIIPFKITLLAKKSNVSRLAYREFIRNTSKQIAGSSTPTGLERKWCRDVGVMREGTMRDIRLSTRNTYLQSFHYRIVSRIISTNTFLFRIGKSDNPLCSFCQSFNETLLHFFWECVVVQDFIKQVSAYVEDKFSITPGFTAQSWFFPSIAEEQHLNVLVITIAKLVIFRARHRENIPNVQHFHSLLKIEAQKEEILAIRTNTKEAFLRKWGNSSNAFS